MAPEQRIPVEAPVDAEVAGCEPRLADRVLREPDFGCALHDRRQHAFHLLLRDRPSMRYRVFGVRRSAVIALAVVLDRKLPVRDDRIVPAVSDFRMLEAIRPERLAEIPLDRLESRRLIGEADENEPREYPCMQAPQP